jgi:hypothetical protein
MTVFVRESSLRGLENAPAVMQWERGGRRRR